MPTDFPTQEQMRAFEHFLGTSVSMLPRVALMLLLSTLGILIALYAGILVLRLLDMRRLIARKSVLLELTPQAFTDLEDMATKGLFSELHAMEGTRTFTDKLLRRQPVFAPEIVSTFEGGIRYIIRVAESQREEFEREFVAYAPHIKFQQVDDYLHGRETLRAARLLEFRQTHDPAYPLKKHTTLDTYDPAGYITNALANPKPGELLVLQYVLTPTQDSKADKMAARVLHNEEQIHKLGGRRWPTGQPILSGINTLLFGLVDGVGEITHGQSRYPANYYRQGDELYRRQVAERIRPARTLGAIEQTLAQSVYDKSSQNIYRVSIRALVLTNEEKSSAARTSGIRKALGVFDTPKYQKIRARFNFPYSIRGRYRTFIFRHRLPGLVHRRSMRLSASEVAGLYHFPHSKSARTEGVIKHLSKSLPVPPVIKKRSDNHEFDVVMGRNFYHGGMTDVGLVAKEREKHVYVIGGTGNGKTTLMQYAIVQDIRAGKGVAVVDPHGDLAKTILKYIPKERIKDVVYLNPVDIKHPIGLNLLEVPEGLDEDELLLEKGRVASAVVSVMRKVFSDDEANAHRIEAVMRNAIHTALTVEGATLFTVLKLLRNAKFRKEVVSRLDDEDLKDFWQEEIGQAGDMQMVSMTKGATQRIDRFNISVPAKRMLGQAKSTINFEDIMNSGKILICNLAHGELEEDESSLFGTTVLAKLKMAAERRARMAESERKPFYVYVDEFQNFATTPFVKMLSSSRKYKLFLTIAEQSTKQQDEDRLTEAILSNVSTVVCFRTGSHDDEELMLHKFEPFIKRGDISNLPAYHFYLRVQAEQSLEPMSGETIVLAKEEASESVAREVVQASRDTYATTYVKPAPSSKPKNQSADPKSKKVRKKKANAGNDALEANDDR